MDNLIERFLRKESLKRSENTARHRRTNLNQFEIWLEDEGISLEDVSAFDIEDHLLDMSDKGLAPKTIRGRYDTLSRLYGVLSEDPRVKEIDENPMEEYDIRAELGQVMKGTKKSEALKQDIFYVTPGEKKLLAENVPNPKLRNELIIRLLWQTGLRQGELVNIKLSDIDREERSIKIRAEKTYSNRTVYYHSNINFLMDQWIDGGYRDAHTSASDSQYLLLTRNSATMQDQLVNDIVKDAARDAGIQEVMYEDAAGNSRHKITSHSLRHGFAVQSLKNGMDIRSLSKSLGHANLETTKRYLQITEDDVKDAIRRFGAGTESAETEQ